MAATLAMAIGTALTTGLVAALAVFARACAQGRRRTRNAGRRCHGSVELLAAAFVLVLGATLLFGMWSTAGS